MSRTARGPNRAPARLVTPRSIGTPTSAMSSPPKSGRSGASGRNGRSNRVETPANGIARWYLLPNTSDNAFRKSAGAISVSLAPSYLARSASSFALSNMLPRLSAAPHPRQDQMLPWIGHFADRDLDQGRAASLQCCGKLAAQPIRRRRPHPGEAKAFRHLREVGVVQIDPYQPVVVILLLHAPDIAVRAIGKDDRNDIDAVFGRSRQFLNIVHEAAIARDRDNGAVGPTNLGAERGRKAEAQGALVTAMDVGARVVDRKSHPPDIADLRQILDINAFVRQLGADRLEIGALRSQRIR